MRLLQDTKRLDEALSLGFQHVRPTKRARRRKLADSLGTVSATMVTAHAHLPHFARSTMDGYCVSAGDTHGASESMPAMLTRGIDIHPVLTGGAIAHGTDAVVMLEFVEELEDGTVLVQRSVASGENILGVGEDVPAGVVLVPEGEILRTRHLALLAAFGHSEVEVVDFRVLILSSGNEIVPINAEPGHGQVRDINAYYLQGLCRQLGLDSVYGGIIPDDEAKLRAALGHGLREFDAVLLSGGSSAGSLDFSRSAIDALGEPGVLAHGLMIKPGKPTIVASCQGKLILGLPGHPLSCALTAHTLARPLLAHAAGVTLREPRMADAVLSRPIASSPGRRDHIPVLLTGGEALPLLSKSAVISVLSRSNGLLTIEEGCEGLSQGQRVLVEMWEE